MTDKKNLEERYELLLRHFFKNTEEESLFQVSELGKDLMISRLGPDVLLDLHSICLKKLIKGKDPLLISRMVVNANDILLHGMMAYAMSFYSFIDALDTERKQRQEAQARLEQSNIRLRELDQLKSMFIASMSHELRTPLNTIIGFTGLILMGISGQITEEQKKQLSMVKKSAEHLLSLINDIIDVSKIEAGKIEPSFAEFDLSALVREIGEGLIPIVTGKGLSLSLKAPEKFIIRSDKRRIKEVLINLTGNALKFTDQGQIEITLIEKEGSAQVSVKDSGIGIKEEEMHKLFKPFSRISTEGKDLPEGTGLGLYLSKKILDLLGGRIWAKSKPGQGSEFIFLLPRQPQDVPPYTH